MVFSAAAAGIGIALSVIAVTAPHDREFPRSEPHPVDRRATASAPIAAPPADKRYPRPVSSARANEIARRFAIAWRAWDAGRPSPRVAAVLRRSSVAALWRRLRSQRERPTAARPPESLALQRVRAVAAGRGIWRAAIIARHPPDRYLATLVIVATPAGPMVTDLER
jgi:hypothetical protein